MFYVKKNGEGAAGDVLYMYWAKIKVCVYISVLHMLFCTLNFQRFEYMMATFLSTLPYPKTNKSSLGKAKIKLCNFYSEVCYLIVGYENKSMVLCL